MEGECYDVVCIGFGISALAFAVAHRERCPNSSIVFLESRSKSEWRPLFKLPGQDMNTSFMADLITTENPRSRYSFVKYLHSTGRLVNFTNVGKINPAGELFDDYLRWVAAKFESTVRWGTKAVSLQTVTDLNGAVSEWKISSSILSNNQQTTTFRAKRVVLAVGSQPRIPQVLQQTSSTTTSPIVHSSNCAQPLQDTLSRHPTGASIAIIGDGQPAAEILEYLHGVRGNHRATLYTESENLRPSSETSFEHDQVANPPVDALKRLPPELRSRAHVSGGVPQAHNDLIEHLYELQYTQGVKQPDENNWRFQIKPSTKITKIATTSTNTTRGPGSDDDHGRVELTYLNKLTDELHTDDRRFDLVIAARGYEQVEQQKLLLPLGKLLENGKVSVDGNYRVNLRKRGVVNGRGLWLVGSLAAEQYTGDAVFQILAERSRRLVDSLLAIQAMESLEKEDVDAVQARL